MKTRALFFVACLLSFQAATFAQSNPKDMLGLFITVPEKDSLAGITETDSSLVVTFVTADTKKSRLENVPMNALQRQKILAAYQEWARAPKGETAGASSSERKDISAQRRNHLGYVTGQTMLSYYVYSLVWPIGFNLDGTTSTALSLITLPGFFAGHYIFQKRHQLHDAQIAGINYLTTGFLGLTYSVPFAMASNDNLWDAFRAAAIASTITYPLGIYCGYQLGTKNVNNVGRIDMQSTLAWSGYVLGLTSPMIYLGTNFDGESTRALAFSSAIAFFAAGHFCGNKYLENTTIPRGNPAGISSYGLLGLSLGLTADAWMESDNLRVNVGIPWACYLGGLALGMNVFKDRRDLLERGTYNSLGMLGGLAAASGFLLLSHTENIGVIATALTAGTYAGYFLTNHLTRDLVEKPDSKETAGPFQLHLSLAPNVKIKRYQGRPFFKEYSITPIAVNF